MWRAREALSSLSRRAIWHRRPHCTLWSLKAKRSGPHELASACMSAASEERRIERKKAERGFSRPVWCKCLWLPSGVPIEAGLRTDIDRRHECVTGGLPRRVRPHPLCNHFSQTFWYLIQLPALTAGGTWPAVFRSPNLDRKRESGERKPAPRSRAGAVPVTSSAALRAARWKLQSVRPTCSMRNMSALALGQPVLLGSRSNEQATASLRS